MDNPSPLTQSHTKPPGAAAQPAEPGPNPAGRGAEPNVYITHPTQGAGTRPNGTQPPTATRKTTLNAGQCMRQPREGRGRNRQTPPKKKRGGGGGGARERPTATKPPANTTRDGQTPYPEGTKGRTPKGAQRDHPAKTGNTKPGAAAHRKKGTPKTHRQTPCKKKKEPANHPEREGMRGQGQQGPGHGQPATDTTTPQQEKKRTHPDNPTKKGGAQPRPGPNTHAHTAHPGQERRGTSGARPQTRTPAQHPQPGGARDHAGRAHENTHTPTPPKGVAGRSRNPNPSTHARTAHRKRWGAGGARTQPHTSHKQAET